MTLGQATLGPPTFAQPLRIFVAHPSELLTDHVSHGDGLVAFGFLRRLAERGHHLHVAAQRVEIRGPLPARMHVYRLSPRGDGTSALDRGLFMLRMRLLFERLHRQLTFDLVHQMNPVFTGLSLALLGMRVPLILGTYVPRWEAHADDDIVHERRASWRQTVGRRIAAEQQRRAAGLLLATPQALARIVHPERHDGRIFEVPHGIDLARFTERPAVPQSPSVLFLAGVARRKGIFTLIDAFDEVARAIPQASLVIAGVDGGALDEVRARVAAMPGARIRIVGAVARDQVQGLMHAASVYCLPSYGEPFATSVLEAMACGLPVVTTKAGGLRDLVSEAGGRLVPPRDAASLAAALIEVLANPGVQQELGRYNRARMERVFNVERTVDRLEHAYRSVLDRVDRVDRSPSQSGAGSAAPPHALLRTRPAGRVREGKVVA